MSLVRIFILGFIINLSLSTAFGQGGTIIIYSIPDFGAPAIGCDCANPVAFENGHNYCIYWDNNQNGPDDPDEIVDVGVDYAQGNFACASFGGAWEPGYFETDPAFTVQNLPISPDHPTYYVKAGGTNCCWVSQTFTLIPGFQTLVFTDTSWTCSTGPCDVVPAPPAPTNLVASDDSLCMQIAVSWEHTGVNLTGFNLYVDGVFAMGVPSIVRDTVLNVVSDGQKTIVVRALNQQVESDPAQDTGSMYVRRFVDGPEGDLSGGFPSGSGFNINFSRPDNGDCGAYVRLSLLVNNQFHSVLCEDTENTDIIEMNCNLPNTPSPLSNCRLLLTTTPASRPDLSYTDTTESTFEVFAFDAPEQPDILADKFSISQNYPNPFNSSTELQFNLPVTAAVRIDVYNIYGQMVTTLVNGVMSAGSHSAIWNGTSNTGATLSTGVYLYRMVSGDFHSAGKMMLLR